MKRFTALVLGLLVPLSTGSPPPPICRAPSRRSRTPVPRDRLPRFPVPFSFVGPDQTPNGYSIDLAGTWSEPSSRARPAQAPDQVGAVNSDTRITGVAAGNIDLESARRPTPSRARWVDFSLMTFVDRGSLLMTTASESRAAGDSRQAARRHRRDHQERRLADWSAPTTSRREVLNVKEHVDGLGGSTAHPRCLRVGPRHPVRLAANSKDRPSRSC